MKMLAIASSLVVFVLTIGSSSAAGDGSAESFRVVGVVPASTSLLPSANSHQRRHNAGGSRFATRQQPFYNGQGYFLLSPAAIFQQQRERNEQRRQQQQRQQQQPVQPALPARPVLRFPVPVQSAAPAQQPPVTTPVSMPQQQFSSPTINPSNFRLESQINLLEIAARQFGQQPSNNIFSFPTQQSAALPAPPAPQTPQPISDRREAAPEFDDVPTGRTFTPRFDRPSAPPSKDFLDFNIPPGFKVYDAVPLE